MIYLFSYLLFQIPLDMTVKMSPQNTDHVQVQNKVYKICIQAVLARMAARLPVTAWKPDLMLATEQRDPHVSHCKKYKRVSF